jgi:hypothetical protein
MWGQNIYVALVRPNTLYHHNSTRLNYHRLVASRSERPLHPSQFVVPVKLNASVLEPHLHRQVVRMTVGSLYSANATLPSPLDSIQYSHQRADTRLIRFQDVRLLVVRCLGPEPTSGPQRFPFPRLIYVAGPYTFLCIL